MRKTLAHGALAAALSITLPVIAGGGAAHAATKGGFLGTAAGATDVYALACPSDTRSVRAKVNEADVSGIQMSVVAINPAGRAETATAPDNLISDEVVLNARGGIYLVIVHKTTVDDTPTGEGYGVTLDCHDAAGLGLGVQAERVQNQ
jgi:hypothetical protein